MKVLITGTAGFIGFHLVQKLSADKNVQIIGLDNINDYYDTKLKYDRLAETGITEIENGKLVQSNAIENYRFIKAELQDREIVAKLFEEHNFDIVIHLAAQAGVRYSLENPHSYIESNINGFLNILEGCRHTNVGHLIYASSSSVYGSNEQMPFSVDDRVDNPVSLYAATKKSNELMAHTYSHLFNIPTTGLRFFTVYGPWGRPDMALFLFTKAITENKPIDVYNYGKMARDFTYVDDITEGIVRLIPHAPEKVSEKTVNGKSATAPGRVLNIGNGSPVELMDFINEIEQNLGKKAEKNMMPIQPGDVPKTWADVKKLHQITGFQPEVSISDGVKNFIDWYTDYYSVKS